MSRSSLEPPVANMLGSPAAGSDMIPVKSIEDPPPLASGAQASAIKQNGRAASHSPARQPTGTGSRFAAFPPPFERGGHSAAQRRRNDQAKGNRDDALSVSNIGRRG